MWVRLAASYLAQLMAHFFTVPTFERGGQPLPGQRSSGAYGEGFDCLSQTCSFRGRMRDAAKYVDLMRKLRTAFDLRGRNRYGERYQISAALPATNYYADRFDSGAICAAADFVNVMTCGYRSISRSYLPLTL